MSIRLLIVDDSAVVRRLLSTLLERVDDVEVVGTARNGQHGLEQVEALRPNAVVMDLEMPVMGGLDAVRALRRSHPEIPVLVFSSLTERGSKATVHALIAGAVGYVHKGGSAHGLRGIIEDDLLPKLRQVVARKRVLVRPERRRLVAPSARRSFRAVGIGASTGGPNALATLLRDLPGDLGVPVFVVQHMPPRFTRLLAARLNQLSPLHVIEAAGGERPQPNHVYIAPGGYHMRLRRSGDGPQVVLDQEPPVHACRPAVDPLFASMVEVFGGEVLGVVLTGMGRDGTDGCRELSAHGGTVLAQDQSSSVVWGMPRAVVEADLADAIVPLGAMAEAVRARVGVSRLRRGA